MVRVTKQYYRPNTSVPFHNEKVNGVAPIDGTYFKETYINPGKMIYISNTHSEDGLTMFHESIWIDEETRLAHLQDPQIVSFYAARDAYNSQNGITFNQTTIENL